MKIRVIQPPYPHHAEDTASSVETMLEELKNCDPSLDLILLPECCNAPSGCGDSSILVRLANTFTDPLVSAAAETAKRCSAHVGINLYIREDGSDKFRNRTLLFNTDGTLAARYDKIHLPLSEATNPVIANAYIQDCTGPTLVTLGGIRYSFMTCYDMYYTEMMNRIAAERPDIVLVCSLQRGERHDILETESKTCAFLCNAYVVRSSYFMGPGSTTGGCSMIVSPDGRVLHNATNSCGHFDLEIEDIHYKYARANGYGQPPIPNDLFQSIYRAPWTYRPAGAHVRPPLSQLKHPHVCAWQGAPRCAPGDTLPSLGIALSLGVPEIEVDVRRTKDGQLVLWEDALPGLPLRDVSEMSLEEVQSLNPGKCFAQAYDGIQFPLLQEVLRIFAGQVNLSLFIKGIPEEAHRLEALQQIAAWAQQYDCLDHLCIVSEEPAFLQAAQRIVPALPRCLVLDHLTPQQLEAAKDAQCIRVQLLNPQSGDLQVLHETGIRDVMVLADQVKEARSWMDQGADCIMTRDLLSSLPLNA